MAVTVTTRDGVDIEYQNGAYVTVDDNEPLRIWDDEGNMIGVFNAPAWTLVKEIVPPKPGRRSSIKTPTAKS